MKVENNNDKTEVEPEYIWIEGYKGTDQYMRSSNYPAIVDYKLGAYYTTSGIPEKCSSIGYHLCIKLNDVFRYYPFNFKNRYFKVKALVRKDEYEEVIKGRDTKLAAKTISLYEEVIPEYETIKKYAFLKSKSYTYTISKQEYESIYINKEYENVYECLRENAFIKMIQSGFTKEFSLFILNNVTYEVDKMYLANLAEALVKEDIPKRSIINLLIKKLEKKE